MQGADTVPCLDRRFSSARRPSGIVGIHLNERVQFGIMLFDLFKAGLHEVHRRQLA
jgi:hypothetical protein